MQQEIIGALVGYCDRHGTFKAQDIEAGSVLPRWLERYMRDGNEGVHLGGLLRESRCPRCEREQEIRRRLDAAQIPARFKGATLDAYRAEVPGQRRALDVARDYVARFRQHRERGTSLVLHGRPGTGKTMLTCAILRALAEAGWWVRFVAAADLVREVWAARGVRRAVDAPSEAEVLGEFASWALLVIDEIALKPYTDAERATLDEVIDRRYREMRPTVITSNHDLDGIAEHLGGRALDRLTDAGGIAVRFDWQSWRGREA